MSVTNQAIRDALKELEVLPPGDLDSALDEADRRGISLADLLVEQNVLTDQEAGRVLADLHGLPYVNLGTETISETILGLIPPEMVKKNLLFPFRLDEDRLHVAVHDPGNLEAIAALRKRVPGKALALYYATRADIELAAAAFRQDIRKVFGQYVREIESRLKEKPNLAAEDALKELPIVDIVDELLLNAYQSNASDIHIEPRERDAIVRFRIDGIMHDIVTYPKYMHDLIVTRLKIMARLRTDEHFAAQDGKIRVRLEGEEVDIRINAAPITEGEKVVMRLLTERGKSFSLATIGMGEDDAKVVREAAGRSYGMILSTGPTGSGKTTTMYAIMKILNRREVNITTIEDPVEYDIAGVNQIQVNPKTGITFAAGLKSIVRQNPDIIMVGEIRDEETAGIAVNAAMTGHLVLSTLHTNNAATTLPRLLDMGVEPFLISSSVNLIIAQRLVRRICPKCVRSEPLDRSEVEKIAPKEIVDRLFGEKKGKRGAGGRKKKLTLYRGAKCAVCRHTGYLGRVGVFELLKVTQTVRQMIMRRANADEIEQQAVVEGMTTMLEDGIRKVRNGQTTVEELMRMLRE